MDMRRRVIVFLVLSVLALESRGIGVAPDPVEYEASFDAVMSNACHRFEEYGVLIDPGRLRYGEHEILDSFLYGRESYRLGDGQTAPVSEKLEWLCEILGELFPECEQKWSRKVDELKAGRRHITVGEVEDRLNALRDGDCAPVEMDGGACRSSSGEKVEDVECIHCGRRTVYRHLDERDDAITPGEYEAIAKELRRWGLDVDVDGRAACPDCCPFPCDFRIQDDFPVSVRLRDTLERPENERDAYRTSMLTTGMVVRVMDVYTRQDGETVYSGVPQEEPEVVGSVRRDRVLKRHFRRGRKVYVQSRHVAEVMRGRSAFLRSVPPAVLTFNGRRSAVSRDMAELLLAFVQGYDTAYVGDFHDHVPLKAAEPLLRSVLLTGSNSEEMRLKRETLADGAVRWSVNQAWYFSSVLPSVKSELEPFVAGMREISVPIERDADGARIAWNVFGTTPDGWICDWLFGAGPREGESKIRHFVVLVTEIGQTSAACRIYELPGDEAWSFGRKWIEAFGHSDLSLSSVAEFRSKDPDQADVLLVTPWLCRGTSQYFIVRKQDCL